MARYHWNNDNFDYRERMPDANREERIAAAVARCAEIQQQAAIDWQQINLWNEADQAMVDIHQELREARDEPVRVEAVQVNPWPDMDEADRIRNSLPFKEGEMVLVTEGHMSGHLGTITDVDVWDRNLPYLVKFDVRDDWGNHKCEWYGNGDVTYVQNEE